MHATDEYAGLEQMHQTAVVQHQPNPSNIMACRCFFWKTAVQMWQQPKQRCSPLAFCFEFQTWNRVLCEIIDIRDSLCKAGRVHIVARLWRVCGVQHCLHCQK